MSGPPPVSRADLLRLLAACPDARLDMAAQLAGCQTEEFATAYESHPAKAAEPASPARFWHLRRRERLQARRGCSTFFSEEQIPAELRQFRPLSTQELHWPDSTVPPPSRPAARPALAKLVNAAASLRPQQPKKRGGPSAVSALAQFRTGQLPVDWLELQTLRLVRAWFARKYDADLIRAARALLTLLPDKADWRRHEQHFSFLHAIAHWDALRQGAVLPEECRPETVLRVIQEPQPPATWLLIQEGEELFLVNSPEQGVCLLKGSRIAALTLTGDMLLLRREGRTEIRPAQTALPLCSLLGLRQLCLQTTQEKLYLQTCVRPAWATLIGRNSQELFAEIPWLGRSCRLRWQPPAAEGEGRWFSAHGPVATDAFGLHAQLGFHGKVMQRFRWLEPGRFLMGSPADEPEREVWGKESLHEVLLSKGFWLGETSVSQALWQFVMGGNPAKFQGDDHPVDSVSWDDAQHFLARLNAMAPGLAARLPTEAEWEYACRAGTAAPFAFGAQITPELVNYNGTCPYHGGVKGLFRRRTAPVGCLPANAWGLHEMHGNLWEWCQDFWRNDLGCEAAVDPQGPESGEFCVVRGGSWFLAGKGVRSAARGRFAPDFRSDRVGFRIACDHAPQIDSTLSSSSASKPPPSYLRLIFRKK